MSGKGGWETVVNKKKGPVTKADIKKAQQNLSEGNNVPKVAALDPIKFEKTMFEAGFREKDEKHPSIVPLDLPSDEYSHSPRARKEPKKKKQPKPPAPVVNMAEKVNNIQPEDLQTQIKEVKRKFAGHQLIWLKEVTNWLQLQLTGPNEKADLGYLNQEFEYPKNALKEEVKGLLCNMMKKCDKNILKSYFVFLVACLSDEIQKGHNTTGLRVCVQLLAGLKPEVFTECCDEVVGGKARSGDPYLSVIWTFSQYRDNLKDGLTIWWKSMQDEVLDKKQHATASIRYLDNLLQNADITTIEKPILSFDQIIRLIDLCANDQSALNHSPSLKQDIAQHYNLLKRGLLGSKPSETAKEGFTNILSSLRNRTDEKSSLLICKLLVEVLSENEECMSWWIENFSHHMRESSVLLKYMQSNCEGVIKKLTSKRQYKKSVLGTLGANVVQQLDKANEKGRFEKKPGFKDCRKICAAFVRMEVETKRRGSRLVKVFKLLLLVLVTVLLADVYKSGGYDASIAKSYMKASGAEEKINVGLKFTQKYVDQFYGYCGEHLPYYYSKFSYYADPVMEKTWSHLSVAGHFVYKHSEPVRNYANKVLPPLLEKISFFLSEQYRIISTFLISTYNHYAPLIATQALSVYQWLSVNLPLAYQNTLLAITTARTNIYNLAPDTFDKIYVIIMDAYKYLWTMTPVAVDAVKVYSTRCVDSTRGFLHQGQLWMNQQVSAMK